MTENKYCKESELYYKSQLKIQKFSFFVYKDHILTFLICLIRANFPR